VTTTSIPANNTSSRRGRADPAFVFSLNLAAVEVSERHRRAAAAAAGWAAGTLRVLTIKQPWASAIAAGVKDLENRSWDPSRMLFTGAGHSNGWFAVHAGASYQNPRTYYTKDMMQRLWPALLTTRHDHKAALFPQSRIIALAHVTEIVSYNEIVSRGKEAACWALKSTGKRSSGLCWRIDRVVRVPEDMQLPMAGKLGMWRCPAGVEQKLRTLMGKRHKKYARACA
jgi:hypothetical protein